MYTGPSERLNTSALMKASKKGDLEQLNRLLANPEIYKQAHLENNEVLSIAVHKGHINIVARLLDIPAVKEIQAENELNVLNASERGHWDIVNLLISISTPIKTFAYSHLMLLERACKAGQLDTVHQLVKNPEAINISDRLKFLTLASENGHTDVIKELLTAFPEQRVNTFLCLNAATHGDRNLLNYLLDIPELSNSMSTWILTALSIALENEHESIVSALLEYVYSIEKGYVNYQGGHDKWLPLVVAARKDNRWALQSLLSMRIVANYAHIPNNHTLLYTYENKNFDAFNWLLDNAPIATPQDLIEYIITKNDLVPEHPDQWYIIGKLLKRPSVVAELIADFLREQQDAPDHIELITANIAAERNKKQIEDQLIKLIIRALNSIDEPHVNNALALSLDITKKIQLDLSLHLSTEQIDKLNHFMLSHRLNSDGAASSSASVNVQNAPTVLTGFATIKRSQPAPPLHPEVDALTQVTGGFKRLCLHL